MAPAMSPLAPKTIPELPAIDGVALAATACGIRYKDRRDLMLAVLAEGTQAAGVLTQSKTRSYTVDWCEEVLVHDSPRAVIVNSGNANAFTGEAGKLAVREVVAKTAQLVGCDPLSVFMASTGVIGEPLPYEKITQALDGLHASLSPDSWTDAAEAIRTTDTFAKLATAQANIGGTEVTINGIAKGSGMIAPNMATMLAYVFTDAAIPREILQPLLQETNQRSFNSITVDGDCSTNDMVLAFATGRAKHPEINDPDDPALAEFKQAFEALMRDLALQIVRDGEGASKLVTVRVNEVVSYGSAHSIAMAIANSPLVKTAIAGEDPNWGRIVMAVGKAGESVDPAQLSIAIGPHAIVEQGELIAGYDETPVAAYMTQPELEITVSLGMGQAQATVWTCDLTHAYIDINADYRS